MTIVELYVAQQHGLQDQLKPDEEVRAEAMGIEVGDMYLCTGDILLIHGFDESNAETVVVCPLSHFSGRLSIVPKQPMKQILGFRLAPGAGASKL
jgi:hypothetical protein